MVIVSGSVHIIDNTASDDNGSATAEVVYGFNFTGEWSPIYVLVNAEAAGMPASGEEHPELSTIFASKRKPQLDQDSPANPPSGTTGYATLTVNYSGNVIEDFGTHPLDRDPEIEGAGSDLFEVKNTDTEGTALTNSAKDFLDPLPEQPVRCACVVITRNEEDNPLTKAVLYSHSINDAALWGVPEAKIWIQQISWRRVVEKYAGADVVYYSVTYPIKIGTKEWLLKPIDNGYKVVYDEAEGGRNKTDAMGNPTYLPILLDGEGGELPSGEDPVVYPEDGYVLLDKLDFSTLDLPNPFEA